MPAKRSSRVTEGTFSAVIRAYEDSPEFRLCLEESTKKNYRHILDWIDASLGKYSTLDPLTGIRPKLVKKALDTLAHLPGQQANARALLGTIDSWAAPQELLLRSITFGVRVRGAQGGHAPWTDAQVDYGEKNARADLSRIITIAAHLGQRGSDIVRMRLTDIEEQRHPITGRMYPGIHVTQQKTSLRLWVPFTDVLADQVTAWRREIAPPWLLVRKPDGTPYTRPQLSWHWNDQRNTAPAMEPLKTAGLVLHGLRGTCVVRLRKAGASVLQICSMIGMSEPMVTRYSRLADRTDMALAAVHYLNGGTSQERKLSVETAN